jgi:hypothetical protein
MQQQKLVKMPKTGLVLAVEKFWVAYLNCPIYDVWLYESV